MNYNWCYWHFDQKFSKTLSAIDLIGYKYTHTHGSLAKILRLLTTVGGKNEFTLNLSTLIWNCRF